MASESSVATKDIREENISSPVKRCCDSWELQTTTQIAKIDYKFLAGFAAGFITSIPISIFAIYIIYLRISKHVREIVNEYGRG